MPPSQAYAKTQDLLREALEHLKGADGALCEVVAQIDSPVLAEPWHQLIHQLGVLRDEVRSHVR